MTPCPSCGANAAKERTGTLGESRGVWCTACGFDLPSIEAWESVHREEPGHVWGQPKPTPEPEIAPLQSSVRKMFNHRKHGRLVHACPGVDMLPLIDVDAIPDESLSMVLDYVFGETWTDKATPAEKRSRIRKLVT